MRPLLSHRPPDAARRPSELRTVADAACPKSPRAHLGLDPQGVSPSSRRHPSGVELDASITTADGKTESLGKHSFGDIGARKLRFALPAALKGTLQHGDKVTLTMHAVVSPSSKCTGSYTQDLSLKTRVINVQSSLLLP